MMDLSANSENFIKCALQKQSDENDEKLLNLIEQGLDAGYIRYRSGGQRYDDGYYWGNAYHFLTYVLDNCSLKVMEKLFEKYPEIVDQTRTRNYSEYKGCDAYWVRGLNDRNGEKPYVRDAQIAAFLVPKLPDEKTWCLENAFQKLSLDDCMNLLENPNFSKEKKSCLLETKKFNVDEDKTLLCLRPYLNKIKNITFDLKHLSQKNVLSFLSDTKDLENISFLNFPTNASEQKPFVQKLAEMSYDRVCATDRRDKEIDLQKLIDEDRQNRIEKENAGKEDWKVDFLKKCAVKEFKSALKILEEKGILSAKKKTSESKFGREFDLSPLGWGNNSMEIHNDLIAVDIKDMGNDTFAIGQIYEDRKWRSTVGYNSGVGWYWQGYIAIVNLNEGVGDVARTDTICVRDPEDVSRDIFKNIPREDFVSVNGNTATVKLGWYDSAQVSMPKIEAENVDVRVEEPTETPEIETKAVDVKVEEVNSVVEEKSDEAPIKNEAKSRNEIRAEIKQHKDVIRALSEQLSKTTPKRHELAEKLNGLRHEYGTNAKKIASQSKVVKALREEAENKR